MGITKTKIINKEVLINKIRFSHIKKGLLSIKKGLFTKKKLPAHIKGLPTYAKQKPRRIASTNFHGK